MVSPVTRRPTQRVVDAVTDLDHHAAPLVSEPHRELGLAVVQVGHLAGEELDVGATDADPVDVDHDLARGGRRRRDVLRPRLSGRGHDERPHRRTGSGSTRPASGQGRA